MIGYYTTPKKRKWIEPVYAIMGGTEGGSQMKELRTIFLKTNLQLQIVMGNLVREAVDAIVNPANNTLVHGGGVAAAIARAGGPRIDQESQKWVQENGPVPTGGIATTSGGDLEAKWVIHAVGPIWRAGDADEDRLLSQVIFNALSKANELQCISISLPAISSGIFGFPKDRCARIFMETVQSFAQTEPPPFIETIRLCNIDVTTSTIFFQESVRVFPDP